MQSDILESKLLGEPRSLFGDNRSSFVPKPIPAAQQQRWREPELLPRHPWSVFLMDSLCIWLKRVKRSEGWNPPLLIKAFPLMLSEPSRTEPALLVFVMGPRLMNNDCAVMRNPGKPLRDSERYPHVWQQAATWQQGRGWKPWRLQVWQE